MIKDFKFYKFILIAFISIVSNIFSMEESEKKAEKPKKYYKVSSLQNLTLKVLHNREMEFSNEFERAQWFNSLPKPAADLLSSKYGKKLNVFINEAILKIEQGNTDFKKELEQFVEFDSNSIFTIIKYLFSYLDKNWEGISNESPSANFLNSMFKLISTYNINLVLFFRHYVLKAVIKQNKKLIDLQLLENSENQNEIIQRQKLAIIFYDLGKICEDSIIKFEQSLKENKKNPESNINLTIREIAEELIKDFEQKEIEKFVSRFKDLKSEDQENVLNYIFAIYVSSKKFLDENEMVDYIDNIIYLFQSINKDLSSALKHLLEFYNESADIIWDEEHFFISRFKVLDYFFIYTMLIPKFYLILTLKRAVLKTKCEKLRKLFDLNETSAIAQEIVNFYYKFNSYQITNSLIVEFYDSSWLLIEQIDKAVIIRFLDIIKRLQAYKCFDEEFFQNLKWELLVKIKQFPKSNKHEIKALIAEAL